MYYKNNLHEKNQQYKDERQIVEQQQDQIYAFALQKNPDPTQREKYYLIGQKYIYELNRGRADPISMYQNLDAQKLKLEDGQAFEVEMSLDNNQEQFFTTTYTMQYAQKASVLSVEERHKLLSTYFFRVKNDEFIQENKNIIGRLIQHSDAITMNELQHLNKSYPIKLNFYTTTRIKDGHPTLSNIKGYGAVAILDLITLPAQILMF